MTAEHLVGCYSHSHVHPARKRVTMTFAPPAAKTAARGYGGQHQKLRAQWAPRVAAGQVKCWRCKRIIQPDEAWDLGHDDHDPTKTTYRGPEHRHPTPWCKGNRKAGLIKAANRKRKAKIRAKINEVVKTVEYTRW